MLNSVKFNERSWYTTPRGRALCLYWKNVLQHNSYSYVTISLNINIDGLSLFKSAALDLWPIVIQYITFLPIGVAFHYGKFSVNKYQNDFC